MTPTTKRTFHATLGGETGQRPSVELPFDVVATYGSARPKVKVTVQGVELRTTVAVYGGRSYLGFREDVRRAAGIAIGDVIEVTVERDMDPRVVEIPPDLAAALTRDRAARTAFDALAFSHRKEYASWVAGAKRPETRARRVASTIDMLKAGTKHP